jgi:iron complex outermembrane receptor protein
MHVLYRGAAMALAAAACHGAQAQDSASRGETRLAEVTVVDQRQAQAERREAPIQKIVIAEDEVERFGDATVGDVLRRLPGMTFTGPAGVTKDIRMRGLDKGYTQFLINGEPVPSAKQERQIQIDRLPADMIERIEIIRSPSAEYDGHGIAGTINIVLKHSVQDITRLRAAYGKNGSLDVGDMVAQWSRTFGDFDLLLAASYTVGAEDIVEDKAKFNAAGALTEREHKPRPVEKTETLFAPRLAWRFGGDRLVLEPFVSAGTEDKQEPLTVRNAAGAVTKTSDTTEDKTDTVGRLGARYDGVAGWGAWYLKAGVQGGEEEKDKATTERNAAGRVTKRSQENETVEDDQAYAGGGAAYRMGLHLLKAGLEYRLTDYEKRKQVAEAGSAAGPLVPKAPGANDLYRIEEARAAAYVLDEWQLAAAHWLTPGLRYEHVERDATDRTGATRNARSSAPNPSLHYRWAVQPDLNLRGSYAQTLRLPKFDDINPLVTPATGAGAGSASNPDKGGNPDLEPERATGLELGIEHFPAGGRAVLGANLYYRDVEDFIQKVTRAEGGRFVERPQNVGEAHFWGAEFDWRIPLVREGPHEVHLTGSHAELRGRVLGTASGDVKDLPPRVTNLGLDWRHRPSGWAAGFGFNYQPAYTTDSINPDGVREIKTRNASDLLDLYVTKVFSPLAELRLVAKNALAVEKVEDTTRFKTDGRFDTREERTERSRPTVYLTFESRF